MAEAAITLPSDVIEWVQEVAGSPVVSAERVPGGATREAWFIDVADNHELPRELFVRYTATPMPYRSAFHTLGTEAEIMIALRKVGHTVPKVFAVHPSREAILSERVPGATWFYRITDPEEQVSVARDFIVNLARQHRLDPVELDIPSLGTVKTAREHALERIGGIRWRGTAPDGSMEPLLRLTCDWLERNVPEYEEPLVLVQGDTGPGNFMYEHGKVTAVVDWELAHWGDPMDDIAWLSLRTVQDTFTHLPDRLREYQELSGIPIDVDRVWYYRVFAEATMTTLRPNEGKNEDETSAVGRPVARDIGNGLLYAQLHRRLWLEALAHVMNMELPMPDLPSATELSEWHHLYDDMLGSMQLIVPRIGDPLASQWTKGIVRVVKYLKELDATGRLYDSLEREEIARLIGHSEPIPSAARAALAEAARSGKVTDEDYVQVLFNKMQRDEQLLRTASGALHERTWPPLI